VEFPKLVTLTRKGSYGTEYLVCDRGSDVDFGKPAIVKVDPSAGSVFFMFNQFLERECASGDCGNPL